MPTTTHRVLANSITYVSISDGAPNVSLIVREQALRVVVNPVEPDIEFDHYLKVAGRTDGRSMLLSVTDLEPTDHVWVRNDMAGDPDTDLRVVRGSGKVLFSSS